MICTISLITYNPIFISCLFDIISENSIPRWFKFSSVEMVLITNCVRATNFHSYIKDLFGDLHCQFPSSYVLFASGHLSFSVAPYILASTSPMFKSILLEDPSLCSVSVHPSFSKVFPSLITLLYTGQVIDISKHEAELLEMLIKDLGIIADIEKVHVSSHSTKVKRSLDAGAGAIANPFKSSDDAIDDNTWRKKKSIRFSFDSAYDSFEENIASTTMCSQFDPEGVRFQGAFSVSADGHKDRAIVDVVSVLDHEVDEIVENVGGSFNYDISSYVLRDAFCDVEQLKSERCNICDQDFSSKYELLHHLAMTHYKAKLAENFSEYGRICPMCEEFKDDHEDNLYHIGRDHEVAYDYYQADEFVHYVDEFSGFNNERRKMNQEKPKSINLYETNGRKLSCSRPSVLKGILKSARVHQEDPPKSILRVPSLNSPSTKESILKRPKSQVQSFKNQVKGKEDGGVNVLLSVQDKSGDKIIDLE